MMTQTSSLSSDGGFLSFATTSAATAVGIGAAGRCRVLLLCHRRLPGGRQRHAGGHRQARSGGTV